MTDESSLGVLVDSNTYLHGKRYYLIYQSSQNEVQLRNLFINLRFEDSKTIIVLKADEKGLYSTHVYINGLNTMTTGGFKHKDNIFDVIYGGIKYHPIIRKISTNECEKQVKTFLCKLGGFDAAKVAKILDEKTSKMERLVRHQISSYKNSSNKEDKKRNIFNEIFYPPTWQKNVLSMIEDFIKNEPENFLIHLSDSGDNYKIYWIVTNKQYDDSKNLIRYLTPNNSKIICEDCSVGCIARIEEYIRKNGTSVRYAIVFRMPRLCSKDLIEYLILDSLRNGQIPSNNNIQLKYVPLIVVISSELPSAKQGYIYNDDLMTYQVVPNNGKMILNSNISAQDFSLETAERNKKQFEKYMVEINQQRSKITKEIDDFKNEYSSKSVLTANTDLLVSLEKKLKYLNEKEQMFKKHIDDYFREKIDRWNMSDYVYNENNYIEDYTLVETKTSLENSPVNMTKNNIKTTENRLDIKTPSVEEIFIIGANILDKNTPEKMKPTEKKESIQTNTSSNVIIGKRRTIQ